MLADWSRLQRAWYVSRVLLVINCDAEWSGF
jgi:hypothetical protein